MLPACIGVLVHEAQAVDQMHPLQRAWGTFENKLHPAISIRPQVRIIVVDSITFHFRQDFQDLAHRTRVLTQVLPLVV